MQCKVIAGRRCCSVVKPLRRVKAVNKTSCWVVLLWTQFAMINQLLKNKKFKRKKLKTITFPTKIGIQRRHRIIPHHPFYC